MSAKNAVTNATASLKVVLLCDPTWELLDRQTEIEVSRCEDVSEIPRLLGLDSTTILVVYLAHLSEPDRKRLSKVMAQFQVARAIVIVDSIDQKVCENLVKAGFVGALRGDETIETTIRAIKAVTAGELWFPRMMLSRLLRGFLSAADPNRPTSRETEILELIAADFNNQQVADKLCLSRETVRWHVKSLHSKFGTRTRRALRDQARVLTRLKSIPPQRESAPTRVSAVLR